MVLKAYRLALQADIPEDAFWSLTWFSLNQWLAAKGRARIEAINDDIKVAFQGVAMDRCKRPELKDFLIKPKVPLRLRGSELRQEMLARAMRLSGGD